MSRFNTLIVCTLTTFYTPVQYYVISKYKPCPLIPISLSSIRHAGTTKGFTQVNLCVVVTNMLGS